MATSPHPNGSGSRTLHLVDLENLDLAAAEARDTFVAYLDLARWSPGDHVIVAAPASLVRAFAFDPPVPGNIHTVQGPDAADLMLLSLVSPEFVARNYDRLVIGSGDGIFPCAPAPCATLASGF